jgi:hypothetical protein
MVDVEIVRHKAHDMDGCKCGHTRFEHEVFIGLERVICCGRGCECQGFELVDPV